MTPAITPELRERAGKDRPIIFSAPMVRALIEGRKTQTRRVLSAELQAAFDRTGESILRRHPHQQYIGWDEVRRLWVKEEARRSPDVWVYTADSAPVPWPGRQDLAGRKRDICNSMFLPRSCSRLTLEVTEVRVERLHDISEADAEAEGPEHEIWDHCLAVRDYSSPSAWFQMWGEGCGGTYVDLEQIWRASYRTLWNSIHGKDAWDANPWVAAISFRVILTSLDAPPASPLATGEAA